MTDPVTTVRPEPGRHWPSSPLSQEQEIRARALEMVIKYDRNVSVDSLWGCADLFAAYITSGSKPGEK